MAGWRAGYTCGADPTRADPGAPAQVSYSSEGSLLDAAGCQECKPERTARGLVAVLTSRHEGGAPEAAAKLQACIALAPCPLFPANVRAACWKGAAKELFVNNFVQKIKHDIAARLCNKGFTEVFPNAYQNSVGLVVEYPPATRKTRVQFPDVVSFLFFFWGAHPAPPAPDTPEQQATQLAAYLLNSAPPPQRRGTHRRQAGANYAFGAPSQRSPLANFLTGKGGGQVPGMLWHHQ